MAERFRFQSYPRERIVLALIALSAFGVVYQNDAEDRTRLAAAESVIHGTLNVDPYSPQLLDQAERGGHWYSDKPPGISFLVVPIVAVGDLSGRSSPSDPPWGHPARLWFARVLTSGLGLILAAFLVGRVAEGLRAGTGAPVAVTFALGTLAGPLAAIMFSHDLAGALGLASFVLAARGRRATVVAGAVVGLGVLVDYTVALIAAAIAVYVLARYGVRALVAFVLGGLPAAVLLGAYNLAAFGSPLHLSYSFVAPPFNHDQRHGLFGVGEPSMHGFSLLLLTRQGGLLLLSPVLIAAGAGLVLLARRGWRAEAWVCLAVTVVFGILDAGYWAPLGGLSPGPRYFVPAMPFLVIGLAEAYHRWPIPTAVLALASIIMITIDTLTWKGLDTIHLQAGFQTVWSLLGVPRTLGIALLLASVATTTLVAGVALLGKSRDGPRSPAPAVLPT